MAIKNPENPNLDNVRGRDATPEEIARRDGYVQGRNDENYVQGNARNQERAAAQAAANDSAASGMIVGMVIALLAAGTAAVVYFATREPEVVPAVTPQEQETPQLQREIIRERNTTVIERDNSSPAPAPEVNVEVPETPAPDVNITNEAPAPEPAAAPEPEAVPEPEAAPADGAPVEGTN